MPELLIAYDTTEGQTRTIAEHLAESATARGFGTTIHSIRSLGAGLAIAPFDAAVVGASIHMGKHSKRLLRFLDQHGPALNRIPSAFFSVSLSAAGNADQLKRAAGYLAELLAEMSWKPCLTATFAGGLRYREYGLVKRWFMKRIAGEAGRDMDTSRNHEYTDWESVDRFLAEFLEVVQQGRQGNVRKVP